MGRNLVESNRTGYGFSSKFHNTLQRSLGFAIGDSSVGEQLYHLQQGQMSVTDYALKFRTLAVASGWDERALITTYRQGLNPALRLHLAIYDDVMGVEKFIHNLSESPVEFKIVILIATNHHMHSHPDLLRIQISVGLSLCKLTRPVFLHLKELDA